MTAANIWCKAWDKGELSDEVLADKIGNLLTNKESARGFFVISLSSNSPLMDRLPEALVFQLREAGEIVVELAAKNLVMSTAMAIHQELAESGIDLESDEYYSQLDNRLREELPNRFQAENNVGNSGKPVQTVVSGTRTTGNGRSQNDRRVGLTPSEQAIAKKLGVSYKEYAKQKLRLQAS